jgi:hypothetical protein
LFLSFRSLQSTSNLLRIPKTPVRIENAGICSVREIIMVSTMTPFFIALLALVASSFRTRAAQQAEIVALRHQIAVLATKCATSSTPSTIGPTSVDLVVPFLAGLAALAAHPGSRTLSCAGIGGRLRAIGPANRVAVREDQAWLQRFAI